MAALSGAAFLAGAKDRHELELRESELRTRFASGWWYGADKRWHQSSYTESCQRHEIEMRRLITNAYMNTSIELAKSGKVKPLSDNPYQGDGRSPGALALGTSNMLWRLQDGADSTKSRRRQIYKHGRPSDIWGTFFLLALSEHLKERSKKKQPDYTLCNATLTAVRGRGGKSAKERISQFKKAHIEWPQLIDQAARDFSPPDETKLPAQAPLDPLEQAIALVTRLIESGKLSAAEVNKAIKEDTLAQLLQNLAKKSTSHD